MIGFNPSISAFIVFIIVIVLIANVGAALGLLLGIAARDSSTAIALVPIIILPFVIFSGFFVNSHTVPVYFIWVPYISFVRYAFGALVINEVRILA